MKAILQIVLGLLGTALIMHVQGAAEQKSLLELEYGTYFEGQNGSLFASSDGIKLNTDTNIGLLAIGFFNPTYNIEQEAKNFRSANFKDELLANFNLLASSTDWSKSTPGYLTAMGAIAAFDNPLGVGGEVKPFLITIPGASSLQDAFNSEIREFGIFYDSSWGFLPEGGFFPVSYSAKAASFDSVILGAVLEDAGLGLGNAYAAQMIPEPSTYGLLIGIAALGLVCYRRRQSGQVAKQH